MNTIQAAEIRYLDCGAGRLSYTVEGEGPLVVAVPGMGDLRSTYRELAGPIVKAGFRLAVLDLRGHGSSDTTFRTHGDAATGQDLLALIAKLGGPAVVVGNSMGASAAVWAAAESPEAVAGLVLLAPLLREAPRSRTSAWLTRQLYRAAFARPWGAAFWSRYYASLNRGKRAPWLAGHVADIRRNLQEPGRLRSFRELAVQLDHSLVEARLGEVTAPATIFVGSEDPDYKDPEAELAWFLEQLDATGQLIEGIGHYPQAQRPDLVVPVTLDFLASLQAPDGPRWARPAAGGSAQTGRSNLRG
jgi:pimeloyl-ACP methyl ester carboxylesterase